MSSRLAATRRYYASHVEREHNRLLQWRRENPDKVAAQNRRNRARRRGAIGSFSQAEWNLLVWIFQGRCAYCWQLKPLTADHEIPISKGGSNYIENIIPACKSCNSQKGTKLNWSKEILN